MLQQTLPLSKAKALEKPSWKWGSVSRLWLLSNTKSELGHKAAPDNQTGTVSAVSSPAEYRKSSLSPILTSEVTLAANNFKVFWHAEKVRNHFFV